MSIQLRQHMVLDEQQLQFLVQEAWPFREAYSVLSHIDYKTPPKGYVLFETGYGPSGLPHMGTFGEVVRTTMVIRAFRVLSDITAKLVCFSDDTDGMRKVPDTIPNKKEYEKYLGLPLTAIPDPFGTHQSYGHHMNAKLCSFLDHFEFEYEFLSATECYNNGLFNESLLKVLQHYDEIMDVMLPTLGEERRTTYSPFLPICPHTGRVLQVAIVERDVDAKKIAYIDPDTGEKVWTSIVNGSCKLQWKPDFGMRWAAFDVDFEMYGKEHYTNGEIYTKICKILGGKGPCQMFYELFLDESGEKISKSKGNGMTIDNWLRYAPKESLALFMYISPRKAKRLYFDVIPKCVDDYIGYLHQYHEEDDLVRKMVNPVFHIHGWNVPKCSINFSYSLLLNLINVCNTDNEDVILGYLKRSVRNYQDEIERDPMFRAMVNGAVNYYHDFVKCKRICRSATNTERAALLAFVEILGSMSEEQRHDASFIQNSIYNLGKSHNFDIKEWFRAIYEILFGASAGPRLGSFIVLFGVDSTIALIKKKVV